MTKKRTSKTVPRKSSTAKSKTMRRTHGKRRVVQEGASGWEIVPFVIAVIVAIVVIVQSIDSATETFPRLGGATALRTHMTAGCEVTGAALREIRGSERGVERSMALLEEAQHQVDWDCSSDPRGSLCTNAKENLQRVSLLVQEEQHNLEQVRIEACL